MTLVIRCRGIGEPTSGRTLLHEVTDLLPESWAVLDAPWTAQYGPVPHPHGHSFEAALREGEATLRTMIITALQPVVLLGFSGGSSLSGNVAAAMAGHRNLAAVGLVADPHMPQHVAGDRWGVAGGRHVPGRVRWVYDRRDPIPCTPRLSPLRTIADQSAAMSLADPRAWSWDLIDRLKRGRWQPSAIDWRDPLGTWRRYQEAAEQAAFYIGGGHVDAYRGQPLTDLAHWIRGQVPA